MGSRGWILLTKDRRIRYRRHELDALLNARVRAFVIVAKNSTGIELASAVLLALPRIIQLVHSEKPPFVATVLSRGEVRLLTTRNPE